MSGIKGAEEKTMVTIRPASEQAGIKSVEKRAGGWRRVFVIFFMEKIQAIT